MANTKRRASRARNRSTRPPASARREDRRYRVFISYSHENEAHARCIAAALERNGLRPLWDEHLIGGDGFTEQIKTLIAHSDVFLPILTMSAAGRDWVHQEIGFATALHIPVLPVSIGAEPRGIIEHTQAIKFDRSLRHVAERLSPLVIEKAARAVRAPHAMYECAPEQVSRATLLTDYGSRLTRAGFYGRVRQAGLLTSFSIPDLPIQHDLWRYRYGTKGRDEHYLESLRLERQVVSQHAVRCGARLIVNCSVDYPEWGAPSIASRLVVLIRALLSPSARDFAVALSRESSDGRAITLVGDWFLASSTSATTYAGYRQTIFTRHAQAAREEVTRFDERFALLLDRSGVDERDSRAVAIDELTNRLRRFLARLRSPERRRFERWLSHGFELGSSAQRARSSSIAAGARARRSAAARARRARDARRHA